MDHKEFIFQQEKLFTPYFYSSEKEMRTHTAKIEESSKKLI